MSKSCACPVPTVIANIITELKPCEINMGQVQKLIFWRAGNTVSTASAILEATWTDLLTATGDTKAVVSPFVSAPVTEGGEKIEFGSGNEVRNGIPIVLGAQPTSFTSLLYSAAQDVITAFKELQCEDLEVIYINGLGQFGGSVVGTAMSGFPLTSLFIGDKKFGGFEGVDTNEASWMHDQNWSDNFQIIDPTANFNPLTLINS